MHLICIQREFSRLELEENKKHLLLFAVDLFAKLLDPSRLYYDWVISKFLRELHRLVILTAPLQVVMA